MQVKAVSVLLVKLEFSVLRVPLMEVHIGRRDDGQLAVQLDAGAIEDVICLAVEASGQDPEESQLGWRGTWCDTSSAAGTGPVGLRAPGPGSPIGP